MMPPDQVTDRDTDAQLMRAARVSPEAFGLLYDRYATALLAFAYRRTTCAQTAADIVAETFAEAFVSRHRFSDRGLSAKPWLFTIARRQLARWYRREAVSEACRQRLGIQQVIVDDESLSRIEQQIDLEPTRKRVADALKDLPTGQADALWLRVGHQLTYAEVAVRLGCTEAAARTRVCRGLAALSTRFDDLEEML